MSKSIFKDKIDLDFIEKVLVYQPPTVTLKGFIAGEEYYVDVKEPSLPAGTAPSVTQSATIIVWDEKVYLEWGNNGELFDWYNIEVRKTSDSSLQGEVEEYEQNSIELERGNNDLIVNGTQYDFIIKKVFRNTEYSGITKQGTPSNKTPQNLSQTINQDNESELSWNSVSGDVIGYRIKIKDSDTGDILNTVGIIVSTSHTFTPTAKGFLDIVVVAVSNQKIFESNESNAVSVYNNESITEFEVSLSGTNDFSSSWDSLASAAGYNLYRKPPNGSYEKVNDSLIGTNSYNESDVLWKNGDHDFYVVPVASGVEGASHSEVKSISIDNIVGIADFTGDDSFSTKNYDASPIEETEDLSNSITHSEQVN